MAEYSMHPLAKLKQDVDNLFAFSWEKDISWKYRRNDLYYIDSVHTLLEFLTTKKK